MAIALVGLPGAGKSALGRRLAQRLQVPFADSDTLIEVRLGEPIRAFFEREGEAAFRDVEAQVLAQLAADGAQQQQRGVLSTGGGAVLRPANRELLRTHFHVIYLRSSPEELFRRVRHDTKRPLLQVADPLGRLRELHAARDALYAETAHEVIETGRPSVAMLVDSIVTQLARAGIAMAPHAAAAPAPTRSAS